MEQLALLTSHLANIQCIPRDVLDETCQAAIATLCGQISTGLTDKDKFALRDALEAAFEATLRARPGMYDALMALTVKMIQHSSIHVALGGPAAHACYELEMFIDRHQRTLATSADVQTLLSKIDKHDDAPMAAAVFAHYQPRLVCVLSGPAMKILYYKQYVSLSLTELFVQLIRNQARTDRQFWQLTNCGPMATLDDVRHDQFDSKYYYKVYNYNNIATIVAWRRAAELVIMTI